MWEKRGRTSQRGHYDLICGLLSLSSVWKRCVWCRIIPTLLLWPHGDADVSTCSVGVSGFLTLWFVCCEHIEVDFFCAIWHCFSHDAVGAGAVFQQQDHLWPGGGEVQRHHLHSGTERPRGVKKKRFIFKGLWWGLMVFPASGWGVSATGGRQRLHLPGEAGGHRWRTPALCHVSSAPLPCRPPPYRPAAHQQLLIRCVCVCVSIQSQAGGCKDPEGNGPWGIPTAALRRRGELQRQWCVDPAWNPSRYAKINEMKADINKKW